LKTNKPNNEGERGTKQDTPWRIGVYAVLEVLKLFHWRVGNVSHCWSLFRERISREKGN